MKRSELRERALCFLYQISVQKEDIEEQRQVYLKEYPISSEEEVAYFDFLVRGVIEKQEELDKEIAPALVDWKFERLPILDKNILRLALFEIDCNMEVPDSVAISEAVILSKKYCDDNARSYINAVLGTLLRQREEQNLEPSS